MCVLVLVRVIDMNDDVIRYVYRYLYLHLLRAWFCTNTQSDVHRYMIYTCTCTYYVDIQTGPNPILRFVDASESFNNPATTTTKTGTQRNHRLYIEDPSTQKIVWFCPNCEVKQCIIERVAASAGR